MNKKDVVLKILGNKSNDLPIHPNAKAYAPSNIALCKYWGKRDLELNLPVTSSLSVALQKKGAVSEIKMSDTAEDIIWLNDEPIDPSLKFYQRLTDFLNLFRTQHKLRFFVSNHSNIPIAAGLASSASGFASIVLCLDKLFNWQLNSRDLSILARLGSGSACRSIWQGFVEWQAGEREDGMDSCGKPLSAVWPELCLGLLITSEKEKLIASRDAMRQTMLTSPFYTVWPTKVDKDLLELKRAISEKDFHALGSISESNAMSMHATMLSAWPPICYSLPETIIAMHKVWELRQQGVPVYFTQDAGPNLKLLFLKDTAEVIQTNFSNVEILHLFPENFEEA